MSGRRAIRIIGWRLRAPLLVLVVFMAGNASTDRPEDAVMHHMASHCASNTATQAPDRMCGGLIGSTEAKKCKGREY